MVQACWRYRRTGSETPQHQKQTSMTSGKFRIVQYIPELESMRMHCPTTALPRIINREHSISDLYSWSRRRDLRTSQPTPSSTASFINQISSNLYSQPNISLVASVVRWDGSALEEAREKINQLDSEIYKPRCERNRRLQTIHWDDY